MPIINMSDPSGYSLEELANPQTVTLAPVDVVAAHLDIVNTIITPVTDSPLINPTSPRITERDITDMDSREDYLDQLEELGYLIRNGQVIGEPTAVADAAAQASICLC